MRLHETRDTTEPVIPPEHGASPAPAGVRGLRRLSEVVWEIPSSARPDMRVPARVFADRELLEEIGGDRSLEQLENVATLPGVVEAVLAMPDVHQGYGFPVGGVAATELPDGVISPGGVGYDINCGVRLLAAPFSAIELGNRREALVHEISRSVPAGPGRHGALALGDRELDWVLREGPAELVFGQGIGRDEDLEYTESGGVLAGADPGAVSQRARERGRGQLGTIGSGNHFIELQVVEHVYDEPTAATFGLRPGQVTVLIHSGSRGLGHQVCTDYVRAFDAALPRFGITLPDRQLSCAPLSSREGQSYLAAMAAAANFAFANRHAMAHRVREAIGTIIGRDAAGATRQVYDVAHNVAKIGNTAAAACASSARAPPGPSRPARRIFPTATGRSASRSSSPAAWAPPATCCAACPARSTSPSARPAMAPAGA
jgi:tRNA-splicing ligase RtcB